jgi:hypothetical protein
MSNGKIYSASRLFARHRDLARLGPVAAQIAEKGGLDRNPPHPVPAAKSGDFARLESSIHAVNLYISLDDAVALALENLDIEYQRLTPVNTEADLLRARAGTRQCLHSIPLNPAVSHRTRSAGGCKIVGACQSH